jgi:adenylate cyclase
MDQASLADLGGWVTRAGLAGKSEPMMLAEFCRRANDAGLPLARAAVIIDTLHPVHEGRAFRWRREDDADAELIEYGPTSEGEAAETWRASPFYRLLETGGSLLRRKLSATDGSEFRQVGIFAAEGMTEFVAIINRFARTGVLGEMDCAYSYWVTDQPGGFSDNEVEQLAGLLPSLALAVKCVSLTRIAGTLVDTYLGRGAGERVLAGRIGRGAAEQINAVLWYSDLRGFTRITDTVSPPQTIALLNDYAEAVISAIHDQGGDVLKLVGDGVLAIFPFDEASESACAGAIAAEAALRHRLAKLNRQRADNSQPTTEVYLGLHIGEVFYGNIGSRERLDFTVIGPAVNEVARIAAMCRSAEREVLLSAEFAAAVAAAGAALPVSVGRYALRGVGRAQELFTLDREAADFTSPA